MNVFTKSFNASNSIKALTLSIAMLSTTSALAASTPSESTSKLLSANFASRQVIKVEAGDFHFAPGQVAPIHTHAAPAIGYVAKGEILYQVEGEKPQLLRQGDAFYEPAGPRILRFDNASATEEAIFIDFNLQQDGEPFIVFEKSPTEHIDRRTLPTLELEGQTLNRADVFVSELAPSAQKQFTPKQATLAYVAEGIVEIKGDSETPRRIKAGETFSVSVGKPAVTVKNVSTELPAKVIAFYLH